MIGSLKLWKRKAPAIGENAKPAIPRGSLQIPPGVVSQIPPPARQDKGLLV
ncbi:hypothetical protein [Bradyrhizobium liaoningense]